jgi:hypothetical protein
MRLAGVALLLIGLPLVCVAACASFTPGAPPAAGNDSGLDGTAPADANGSPLDGSTKSEGGRTPPRCNILSCSNMANCKDDTCDDVDFPAVGATTRELGQCKVSAGSTGRFERERVRGTTPEAFVELAFDLVSIDPTAVTAIATLQIREKNDLVVVLAVDNGIMKLCQRTLGGQTCTPPVPLPKSKRPHFYGTVGRASAPLPSFGVSIDCQELLRLDLTQPFAADGDEVFGAVGCIDAPCTLVTDNLIILTRP